MSESLADHLMDDLVALEETVEALEERLDSVDELKQRVERLEERTDMLQLVDQADHADAEQRRMALIQDAIRDYEQHGRAAVTYNREDVDDTLHHPDVERTTLYNDMRKAAAAVPDDVAEYVPKKHSNTGEAELRFDFSGIEAVDASTLIEGGD